MSCETRERTCPICGGELHPGLSAVRDYISGERFGILRCGCCGAGITEPVPRNLGRYYRGYHGGRHGKTADFRTRQRMAFLKKTVGGAEGRKLLDVGCGEGTFLLVARAGGWTVAGTEMNPEPARKQGLMVAPGLSECKAMAPFGCATLWHSLEHMADPAAVLNEVRRLLAKDSWLIVAVPNAGGWQASLFGADWLHLDVPRHLFHFGREPLRGLLERCGFTVVREAHEEFEYDVLGWSQSALNKLLPTQNLFFRMLTGKGEGAAGWEKTASWIVGSILSAAGVPLTWLGAMCKRGGTLVVAARVKD